MSNVFLKNTATKWQSNLIDLKTAFLLLGSQTMDQAKNWLVFVDDGNDEWISILDCPLILELLKQTEEPKTESFEIPKEFFNPDAHEELPIEELNNIDLSKDEEDVSIATSLETPAVETLVVKSETNFIEKRLHPRFNIRLRVIIKAGKNTFLTYTRDVSMGGISLVNDVPEYIFNNEAEIYITAPDQKNNLMLICSPVASKFGKSRLRFANIEEAKQKILATWLHHIVKPNTKKVTQVS